MIGQRPHGLESSAAQDGQGGGEETQALMGLNQAGEANPEADRDASRRARRTVRVKAEDRNWRRLTSGGLTSRGGAEGPYSLLCSEELSEFVGDLPRDALNAALVGFS